MVLMTIKTLVINVFNFILLFKLLEWYFFQIVYNNDLNAII